MTLQIFVSFLEGETMGDNTMKSTLRACSWSLCVSILLTVFAAPVQARVVIDALGGELEVEGFLSSEARARVGSGDAYLTQWIQRFQLEASLNYYDIGIFDELSFVTIVRPEFDAGYYYGQDIGDGHGRDPTKPSYLGKPFTYANAPVDFGGFDYAQGLGNGLPGRVFNGIPVLNVTGGLAKIVANGYENHDFLNGYEAIFNKNANGTKFSPFQVFDDGGIGLGSGFPIGGAIHGQELRCQRCVDVDNDPLDVALGRTDSSGRLYPFRELYVDAIIDDWWIRVGKQQIVWGKTDFFRMQDLVNPVDFGQHFFFDSFEDIRIPQWIASIQYRAGDIGPLTDTAIQFVWNFDEFQRVGLGNPSHPWAHPFAKDLSVFASFNHYFAVEPCVSAAIEAEDAAMDGRPFNANNVCGSGGPGDMRSPAGFGTPAGLRAELRPEWDIDNTEAGMRLEFRFKDVRFAVSYWYGWNDTPVFKFENINVLNAGAGFSVLGSNANTTLGRADCTVSDLTGGNLTGHPFNGFGPVLDPNGLCPAGALGFPVRIMQPHQGVSAIAGGGAGQLVLDPTTGETRTISEWAQLALARQDATIFYRNIGSTSALTGGHTVTVYKQAHTPGLSFDYFEPWSGVVFRVESSYTFDEIVNNTRKFDWVDKSDIMKWSIGMDRPTFIPWLNKDRTFFLSLQIFDTWYVDHEGDKHTGFLVDEHNFITTFFFLGNYMRDKLKPTGFYVWEEASNSHVAGFNVEWLMDNHWSIKGGFHLIWEGDENFRHDVGPYTAFILPDGNGVRNPYQQSPLGVAHEGIGALRDNDEVFLQLKYQF